METAIVEWARENPFSTFWIVIGAMAVLYRFAASVGEIGRTTVQNHVHHHHGRRCERSHSEGMCQGE